MRRGLRIVRFSWIRVALSRIAGFFKTHHIADDFDSELTSHLEMLVEENIGKGMTLEEARYAARRRLGGPMQIAETNRELRGLPFLETLLQDIRFSLRVLRKNPSFVVAVVLTLALGVGVNSAVFSIVDAFLFRQAGVKDSDRLVAIADRTLKHASWPISYPNFVDWRQENQVFDGMSAYRTFSLVFADDAGADRVPGMEVSSGLFETLGMRPALGRTFLVEEHQFQGAPVAMISYELWQSRFGGDPAVLGKRITVRGEPLSIVGVAAPGFRLGPRADIYVPLERGLLERRGSANSLYAIGRLKSGVTLEQARSQMDVISKRLEELYPATNKGHRVDLLRFGQLRRGEVRTPLLMLLAAASLVLLIACANISSLLLAKAAGRSQEITIRKALGASRTRLVFQMLTESMVLATIGGSVGLLFSFWACRVVLALIGDLDRWPGGAPLGGIGIDVRVFVYTLSLVLVIGLTMGLVPALHASKTSLRSRSATKESRRILDVLVAWEVMLAVVLLCSAGLLTRSLYHLLTQERGFDASRVLTLSLARADGPESEEACQRILEGIQMLPGVEAAAAAFPLPFGHGFSGNNFYAEGTPDYGRDHYIDAQIRSVTPGYFQTLGMHLLKGRWFTLSDCGACAGRSSTEGAVINEVLAQEAWPDRDPLGKRFRLGTPVPDSAWITVVGVAAATKESGLDSGASPEIYMPISGSADILVRAAVDPISLVPAIRTRIQSVDRGQAIFDIYPLEDRISDSVRGNRTLASLLGMFAGIAALLAAVGIYAVVSHSVTRRTQELGIRAALGAEPADVRNLVLRQGMLPVLAGAGLGIAGASATTRVLSSFLFGVKAIDPLTYVAVVLFVGAIGLLSGCIPARRATRINPMVALRYE